MHCTAVRTLCVLLRHYSATAAYLPLTDYGKASFRRCTRAPCTLQFIYLQYTYFIVVSSRRRLFRQRHRHTDTRERTRTHAHTPAKNIRAHTRASETISLALPFRVCIYLWWPPNEIPRPYNRHTVAFRVFFGKMFPFHS